jgi:hypothetical protein
MTKLIIETRTPDGRAFELLVSFEKHLVLAETCMEIFGTRREVRDTLSMLLLVGRKQRGSEGQS